MLPKDRDARNALPVWDGCMVYFPDCWAEIAKVSVLGNKQHGLGAKLRFARDVSTDHANKVMRHMLDHAAGVTFDEDGTYHLAKAAWRALAALQVAIEETKQPEPRKWLWPCEDENFPRAPCTPNGHTCTKLVLTPEAPERGPQHYGPELITKLEEPRRRQPGSVDPEGEVLYETSRSDGVFERNSLWRHST